MREEWLVTAGRTRKRERKTVFFVTRRKFLRLKERNRVKSRGLFIVIN